MTFAVEALADCCANILFLQEMNEWLEEHPYEYQGGGTSEAGSSMASGIGVAEVASSGDGLRGENEPERDSWPGAPTAYR